MSVFQNALDSGKVEFVRRLAEKLAGTGPRSRAFWIGLLLISCLGVVGAVAAVQYTFTCSDANCGTYSDHSITVTVEGDLTNFCPSCGNIPWYDTGDGGTLAKAMATSLGYTPNHVPLLGDFPTLFAYSGNLGGLGLDVAFVNSSGTLQTGNRLALGLTDFYVTAFLDNGPVPEIDQGTLAKTILVLTCLFLFSLRRAHLHKSGGQANS